MSKYIVEVYLPATQREYDVRIPADEPLAVSAELTGQALSRLTEGLYDSGAAPVILERESGAILNINMTPRELSLGNGSKLMLV